MGKRNIPVTVSCLSCTQSPDHFFLKLQEEPETKFALAALLSAVTSCFHKSHKKGQNCQGLKCYGVLLYLRIYIFSHTALLPRSRGSSVSIMSDYGLDDWAIGVRSPAGAKEFFSNLCVQTGSEAHPASCTMGTGGPIPGANRGQGVMLTTQHGV
jgi:hypothetical protein